MAEPYTIYLDVCCLNRPFDDWGQDRIRFEGEAVISILDKVRDGSWRIVASEAIEAELERLPNIDKLESINRLLELAEDFIKIDEAVNSRSEVLENLGFGLYDALHIACAEKAKVDVLLTTDDRMLKKAVRYNQQIQIPLVNPVNWLMTVLNPEGDLLNDANRN